MAQMISGIPYQGGVFSKLMLWNTETWEYQSATTGSGVGTYVTVDNFPAVMSGSSIPVTGTVNLGLTSQYALKMMEDSVNPQMISYVGEAVAGSSHLDAVWRIKRLDTTSGVIIMWAGGVNSFTKIWADRESLNYS